MAIFASPNIVTDGLVLCLDAANQESYPGTGTTWFDISGNGNHATLYNGISFTKNYFTFDATNDYIRTTNTLDLSGTNAVTIINLMRVVSYGSSVKILYELTSDFNSSNFGLVSSYSDNSVGQNFEVIAALRGNSGYNIGSFTKNILNDQKWHNHCIIHDTTQTSIENLIYSDANLAAFVSNPVPGYNQNNSNNFANSHFYIGARGGNSFFANIEYSACYIYNRVLKASEIRQNYLATRGRFGL